MSRMIWCQKQFFIQYTWHFLHIVPLHPIFPNAEVFAQLILIEEINFLEFIVDFFVGQPLLTSEKLGFFFMVEGNPLATNSHVFRGVPFSIGHNLVIIRMAYSIEVEEILYHFGECIIEWENLMWTKVVFHFHFAIFDHSFGLFRKFFHGHFFGFWRLCLWNFFHFAWKQTLPTV